jgi:predicted small secreted protein
MKHILALLFVVLIAASLSACNTIRGAGQDVSAVGRDVSAGARGVSNAMQ